jgi:hypothetical protein
MAKLEAIYFSVKIHKIHVIYMPSFLFDNQYISLHMQYTSSVLGPNVYQIT